MQVQRQPNGTFNVIGLTENEMNLFGRAFGNAYEFTTTCEHLSSMTEDELPLLSALEQVFTNQVSGVTI